MLASPVISYISAANPPQVSTLSGVFTNPTTVLPQTTSVTVNFPTPMVVGSNGLAGLHTEFDIRQSLAVDGSGQITGVISPVMFIEAVKATDPEGQITDLTGTIVSVNVAGNSFVMQGPFGHQFTIAVDGNTAYNPGVALASLPTSGGFVSIQGTVQFDGSILASDVEFITTDQAFISGRILVLNPATGPVQTVSLWVGETGGGASGLLDTVQTLDVSAVSTYDICFFNNSWFTPNNLFGNSSMLVGQRIFIGGAFSNSTFTPDLISLRRQGVNGLVVPGSVTVTSANAGNFQIPQYRPGGLLSGRTVNREHRCWHHILPGQQQYPEPHRSADRKRYVSGSGSGARPFPDGPCQRQSCAVGPSRKRSGIAHLEMFERAANRPPAFLSRFIIVPEPTVTQFASAKRRGEIVLTA